MVTYMTGKAEICFVWTQELKCLRKDFWSNLIKPGFCPWQILIVYAKVKSPQSLYFCWWTSFTVWQVNLLKFDLLACAATILFFWISVLYAVNSLYCWGYHINQHHGEFGFRSKVFRKTVFRNRLHTPILKVI